MRWTKWIESSCLAFALAAAPGCACMWDCVFNPPPGPMVRTGVHEVYRGTDTGPSGYLVGAVTFNAQGTMLWIVRDGYGEPPLLPGPGGLYTWSMVSASNVGVPVLCTNYRTRLMQGEPPSGEPDRWNVNSAGVVAPECQ
jgi:hypothetical protein